MASYFLLNKQVIRFLGTKHEKKGSYGVRGNDIDIDDYASVKFEAVIPTTASTAFSEQVLQSGSNSSMALNLGIQLVMCETIPIGSSHGSGYFEVEAKGENHIFHKIYCMANGKVKLNWTVSDFGVMSDQETNRPTVPTISWRPGGSEIFRSRRLLPISNAVRPDMLVYSSVVAVGPISSFMIDFWKLRRTFIGTFSISVVIEDFPVLRELAVGRKHVQQSHKMLHESVETDIYLVSIEGRDAKCHRAILAVSSDKLRSKLVTQTGRKVDVMNHLSFQCIEALLAYMYYSGVSKINTSVEIAIQVLEAAMEFQLIDLICDVQKSLELKSGQEFTVNDAVKFYVMMKSRLVDDPIGDENDGEMNVNSENESESQEGEFENESQQEDNDNKSQQEGNENESQQEDNENESQQEDNENDSQQEEDKGSEQSEQEDVNSEEDNDDESEEEDSTSVNVQHGLGKGFLISGVKSSGTINKGDESGKRFVVEFKRARYQNEDNATGSNGTSAANDAQGEQEKGTQNNLDKAKWNNTIGHLLCMNLLEKKAGQVISWHLNNNRESLHNAVDYPQLVKSRKVLLEFLKLSLRPYPQQKVGNNG